MNHVTVWRSRLGEVGHTGLDKITAACKRSFLFYGGSGSKHTWSLEQDEPSGRSILASFGVLSSLKQFFWSLIVRHSHCLSPILRSPQAVRSVREKPAGEKFSVLGWRPTVWPCLWEVMEVDQSFAP